MVQSTSCQFIRQPPQSVLFDVEIKSFASGKYETFPVDGAIWAEIGNRETAKLSRQSQCCVCGINRLTFKCDEIDVDCYVHNVMSGMCGTLAFLSTRTSCSLCVYTALHCDRTNRTNPCHYRRIPRLYQQ